MKLKRILELRKISKTRKELDLTNSERGNILRALYELGRSGLVVEENLSTQEKDYIIFSRLGLLGEILLLTK